MKSETSFDLDGDLIVVDAVVVGPTGRASVHLILDTGAVLTTLVPAIAESIGYTSVTGITPTVTRTAAADERGYLIQLVELAALGVTVPAVHANVADLGYGVDGVLGMNFLLDFNIEIRPSERRILVERIAP
ncbi:MAG TPA: retropepsin-like aspartic protease [Kofleriaceae bacterium]